MSVKLKSGKAKAGQITDEPKETNSESAPDLKDQSDEDVSSSDEDEEEDEEGDLLTDKIDHGINEVLAALKSGSANLKDNNYRFFPEVGAEGTREAEEPTQKERPVYLKDYQRERLLNQDGEEDAQPRAPTYNEEQETLKNDLIKQFHDNDFDDDGNDMLLTKREGPSREIPEVELPDPDADAEGFLNAFVSQKGWIPKAKANDNVPTYNQVVDEEDSDEFDDLTDKFESAYNFRFEDPEAAEIVSYARNQSTLRRGKLSSRQKKREKEREAKEKELEKQKLEKAKLKKSKVNQITDKLAQLQEALGEDDERMAELLSKEDLDGDFDNDEWDKRMQKFFDEEYYGKETSDKIAGSAFNAEDFGEEVPAPEDDGAEATDTYGEEVPVDIREGSRLSRKQLKRKAEQFVESNQDLIDEAMLPVQSNFRYREVEPESYGLTSRDILLASDQELNQFVGIKKLASYRDRARVEADRKRYSKSKRLRKWRQEVFGTEAVPSDEAWEKAKAELEAQEQPTKKAKKHKSHKKHKKN